MIVCADLPLPYAADPVFLCIWISEPIAADLFSLEENTSDRGNTSAKGEQRTENER
jgi:hypothetical protein